MLARQAILGVPSLYIEGEHFLTQHPNAWPPTHLPVRIDQIGNLINLLAPLMVTAYKEQQLEYWNASNGEGPHWQKLSSTLRAFWNVEQVDGWSTDDCAMARQLFHAPDITEREKKDIYASHSYLVAIRATDKAKTHDLLSIAVLIGTYDDNEVILTHSLLQGYQKFDSMAQFEQALPSHISIDKPVVNVEWQLFEPGDNFFDHQACTLIALQTEAISKLESTDLQQTGYPKPAVIIPPGPHEPLTPKAPGLEWYQQKIPDWLAGATNADLNLYARYLKDLAALHSTSMGKTYDDDIPPIREYALTVLRTQMLKDHPDAKQLKLDTIRIEIQSPVLWGTFVVPGQVDITTFDLADLALQNLAGLPTGDKRLLQHNGNTWPTWLTVSYIEQLITQADIGSAYPALIKSKLLDNPQESARRQALFVSHLRIQLPLLALHSKIRHEGAVDEQGYRYVAALTDAQIPNRQVDGQTIVIRPLGFVPKNRDDVSQDKVANMFVIGPEDPAAGPCVLYRPMFEQPLTQYPSSSNLLYAIRQSPGLREEVLAWLPESVRTDYARYVFPGDWPEPWAVVDFLVDPIKLWSLAGTLTLTQETLRGDVFGQLFKANANALVELSERQSVSTAEARWTVLKQAGWGIFAAVLPFLGRTLNVAAWIWQVMDQLQQLVDAEEHHDSQPQWVAATDVLLNLGMALTLHIVSRTGPIGRRVAEEILETRIKPLPATPGPVAHTLKQLPKLPVTTPASEHSRVLHMLGAVTRSAKRLGSLLDSFKLENKPDGVEEPHLPGHPHQHLYTVGNKRYAVVNKLWFEVTSDDDAPVTIIDPKQPSRTGPYLAANRLGEWFVDDRLHLRTHSSKSLQKHAEALAVDKAAALRIQLTAFENQKKIRQNQLQQTLTDMNNAPSTSTAAKRQQYLGTLDNQSEEFEAALQKVKALNIFTPLPDYLERVLGYAKVQLNLAQVGLSETLKVFTPKLSSILDTVYRQAEAPQERRIAESRQMIEMCQDVITRLDHIESRLVQLRPLSTPGLRLIQRTKSQLPKYSTDDLKELQVTLARNVCLPSDSLNSSPTAWSTIDRIVDRADIAIHSLRDTLLEHSASRLDERIETLGSLVDQFNFINEHLQDFTEEYAGLAQEEPLAQLRRRLDEFNQRAIIHLALALSERDTLRSQPTPPARALRPKRKFIHTHYNGVVVGEPQLSPIGLDTGLVDIRSPITDKVVATFHEKSPGVWVQRVLAAQTPAKPVNLEMSIKTGQTLLNQLPAFNQRVATLVSQATRSPQGIEHLLHQHAQRLEAAQASIEEALTQTNFTDSGSLSAATINKALEDAVADLYQQATRLTSSMLRQQPPTPAGVQWLKEKKEIIVKKTITRGRLKAASPTYLDEYTISEQASKKVLWYADFHYSATWTTDDSFISARLKTPLEHIQGAAADSTKGMSGAQQLAFFRSQISLYQAQQLFFSKPPRAG